MAGAAAGTKFGVPAAALDELDDAPISSSLPLGLGMTCGVTVPAAGGVPAYSASGSSSATVGKALVLFLLAKAPFVKFQGTPCALKSTSLSQRRAGSIRLTDRVSMTPLSVAIKCESAISRLPIQIPIDQAESPFHCLLPPRSRP